MTPEQKLRLAQEQAQAALDAALAQGQAWINFLDKLFCLCLVVLLGVICLGLISYYKRRQANPG